MDSHVVEWRSTEQGNFDIAGAGRLEASQDQNLVNI